MNIKARIAALLLAMALCVVALASCTASGSSAQGDSGQKASDSQEQTMDSDGYRPGTTGAQNGTAGSVDYSVQEIWLNSRGNRAYGKAYIPAGSGRHPLVVFAHELGTTHTTGEGYAEYFASRGIAYYVFDFPGGSISGSKSDGKTTEMSVMTEAQDLRNVLEAARTWDFVDADRVYLHGGSQGGMVAAVTATMVPDEVAGLVLAYPAFIIPDQLHEDFGSLDNVPDTFRYIDWIDVGRIYAEDVWDYDVYGQIGAYKGPVLILHGDQDSTVPLSYSQRAAEVYQNAQLEVIEGGGHEFFGNAFNLATQRMDRFFQEEGAYDR